MNADSQRLAALLLLLGAAGILYYWTTTQSGTDAVNSLADTIGADVTGIPRGIRNNNPGNIRRNNIQWQGALTQAQVQANGLIWDPDFVQFDTAQNGLRALARILINYAARGDDTVYSIISTYAPSQENDTSAYINAVSAQLKVSPGQELNINANLPDLMAAITTHENGQQPYPADLYTSAISSAQQTSAA